MNHFTQTPKYLKYVFCLLTLFLGLSTVSFAQSNIKWRYLYGSNLAESGSGQLVSRTADGGFIIGLDTKASINGDITSRSNGGSDIWLAKVDDTGEIQWSRLYGGSSDETISSVQSTPDGGFIVSGMTNSPISGDIPQTVNGDKDIWVFKLNSIGNIEWSRLYPKSSTQEEVTSLLPTRDGGYIMTATLTHSPSYPDDDPRWQQTWVVKLNRVGNTQWEFLTPGTSYGVRNSPAEQTNDNGYAFGETMLVDDGGLTIRKPALIKLDQNGNLVLRQSIEEYGEIYSLRETAEGGYILSGTSITYIDYPTPEFKDAITKIDANGHIIWQKIVSYSFNDALPFAGGYIAAGGSSISGQGYNLIKLDLDGNEVWYRNIGGTSGYHRNPSLDKTNDNGFILAGITNGSMGDIGISDGTANLWVVRFWEGPESEFVSFIWDGPLIAEWKDLNIQIGWFRGLNIFTKGYLVQRSLDLNKWNSIGEVAGADNQQHYSFTDKQPMVGKNYYRAIHIDINGKHDTSGVASAIMPPPKSGFKVSPNPATNAIVLSGIEKGNTIRILNMAGIVLRSLTATSSTEYVDISKLPAGNYIVEVTTKNIIGRKTERFVKLK